MIFLPLQSQLLTVFTTLRTHRTVVPGIAGLRAFVLALPYPGMLIPLDNHLAYSLTLLGSLL